MTEYRHSLEMVNANAEEIMISKDFFIETVFR